MELIYGISIFGENNIDPPGNIKQALLTTKDL